MFHHTCRGAVVAVVCVLLSLSHTAGADVVWNEAVNGDLSDDRLNPTLITLSLGANSLIATSVDGDLEYFTFTLAPGLSLSAIMLMSYAGDDGIAFMAVQSGTQFTEPASGTNVANLLGYAHFGPGVGNVGTDILDDLGSAPGAIGFTPPLPSGSYTYWSQQTGADAATYQFDFIVVPSPSAMLLGALAVGMGAGRKRRR